MIDALKDKHPKIEHIFCSNAGIRLMNIDSEIASYVLDGCLELDILPLIIHDSFIVKDTNELTLRGLMKQAVREVVDRTRVGMSLTKNDSLYMSIFAEEQDSKAGRTERYQHRYQQWLLYKKLKQRV